MEAIEFMKEMKRYCKITDCGYCEIRYACNWGAGYGEDVDIVESIEFIKKWGKKHPIKTRQSEFLERYPNAPLNEQGVVDLLPCEIDKRLSDNGECTNCEYKNPIGSCVKTYWSEEI